MRKTLFAFMFLISSAAFAQSGDEAAIRKVLSTQNEAWNRGDVVSFMKGYWENDSMMFIGKTGVTYGYKNTLQNYKKNYPDTAAMGKLTFTLISIKRLSEKYFRVVGKYYLTRTIGDASGHFTLLFEKMVSG
jgi:hypothetical protein